MESCFIALGANLGNPVSQFEKALKEINTRMGRVTKISSYYNTKALNPPGLESQPDYLNCVIELETELEAIQVLRNLLEIETELGRIRSPGTRWGPRAIDLDLLFYSNRILSGSELTLPHPELHKRDFVLVPLKEIAPKFVHPILKKDVATLEAELDKKGVERFIIS